MPDEKTIASNLEPIDEEFDLAKKFGHIEKDSIGLNESKKEEHVHVLEKRESKEIPGAEKDSSYSNILAKISQKSINSDDDDDIKNDATVTFGKMDAESKIQHLLDLATAKGVVHAVRVAKHLDDNYILDTLHDKMIADDFRKALIEKKIITEEE